jgi:gas vesicle protein
MTTRDNTGSFILGAFFGGIVGGIAALLMAPQSGEETQRIIVEKREEMQKEAKTRLDEGQKYTERKFNEARNAIADLFSTGSDFLDIKSKEVKASAGKKESTPEIQPQEQKVAVKAGK